jgi:hypothetical protein
MILTHKLQCGYMDVVRAGQKYSVIQCKGCNTIALQIGEP